MEPGLEDRFVHTIAHEYGHIQQPRADQTDVPGTTVLFASLYQHASDKHHALRDIFDMNDSKAFLTRIGWRAAAAPAR